MRELRISVQGDRLIVETEKKREEMANTVCLTSDNRIVSIGEPEEKVRRDIATAGPEAAHITHHFYPMFDARALAGQIDGLTPQIAFELVEAAITYLLNRARGMSFFQPPLKVLALDIPGYETLSEGLRTELQSSIQYFMSPQHLLINGQPVGAPAWTIRVAKLGAQLITYFWLVSPVLLLFMLYKFISALHGLNVFAIWIPFVFLTIPGSWVSNLLWGLAIRGFVPAPINRMILSRGEPSISLFKKWYKSRAEQIAPLSEPWA